MVSSGVVRQLRDACSQRLPPRLARTLHWEFWPTWAAYAPLAPAIGWWMLRYGVTAPLLANSHPDLAVYLGESKASIMKHIPPPWGVPTDLIGQGVPEARRAALDAMLLRTGWAWPIVLKPDRGYRGAGFRVCRGLTEARAALELHPFGSLVQPFDRGPHELGVFYVREPKREAGRIFAVTLKEQPTVEGDGRSTIGQLVRAHPRRRLQGSMFLARLGERARHVPRAGERVQIGQAGNHCQGAVFRDGGHLVTPEFERRIDEIARGVPGFRFGRFDVRYADPEALAAGEGFKVIELNGVSSEPTNMYDPERSIRWAYGLLGGALRLSFEIGAEESRRTGCALPDLGRALRGLLLARRVRPMSMLSD
jgi:hypothetical protein